MGPACQPALTTRPPPGAALTGHLVRAVNLPLLDGASRPADPAERKRLVEHWHRVNRIRLAVVATAAVALHAGTRR